MKLSSSWSVTASLFLAVVLDQSGPSLGSVVSVCERGYFRPKPTDGGCRPCTVCNSHSVETEVCRHNADTVCLVRRSCSSDAFYNRATGLCRRCTRYCPFPLVKTSPCLEDADAVCSRPRSPKGGKSSRRRGSTGRSRRRKHRHGKRQKPYRQLNTEAEPLASRPEKVMTTLCQGGHFYDLTRRKCVTCSVACEFIEVTACTKNSDRVCRRPPLPSAAETSTVFDPFDSIRFNKLPDAVKSKQRTELLSNEYPDPSRGKRIDSEYQTSESVDNYPKNREVIVKSDSSHMVLSNSPEAFD